MATLVISDLHLGARLGRDVLRRPAALDLLLAQLDGVERLVLLGDTVELLEGRPREAMAAAAPVLRAIGRALGADREVVVVPGNHDRALIRDWLRVADLAPETPVPLDASRALAAVADWLGPARVSASYPGLWLADGVWASHGHYLDRHLLPQMAFGVARGRLGRRVSELRTVADYEAGPHITALEGRLTGGLPRLLGGAVDEVAAFTRAASVSDRLAPLASRALGQQMVRAALPAFAAVVARLRPDARTAIFGHVHRVGPLEGDDAARWEGILNTGCWVDEPVLLARSQPPHPYWPGGCVRIEDDGVPRAMSLHAPTGH